MKRYASRLTIQEAIHICREILANNAGWLTRDRAEAIDRLIAHAQANINRDRDHRWKRKELAHGQKK